MEEMFAGLPVPPGALLSQSLWTRREEEGQHGRHKGTITASMDIVNEVRRPKSKLTTEAKSSKKRQWRSER